MKITRDGIIRKYKGDRILHLWPWKRREGIYSIYSFQYRKFYSSMKRYKDKTDEVRKLKGIDGYTSNELMAVAIGALYPDVFVVLLLGFELDLIKKDLPSINYLELVGTNAICIPAKTEFEACMIIKSFSEDSYEKMYVFNPLTQDITNAVTGS